MASRVGDACAGPAFRKVGVVHRLFASKGRCWGIIVALEIEEGAIEW